MQGLGESALNVLAIYGLTQLPQSDECRGRRLAHLSLPWLLASLVSPALQATG